MRTSWAVLACVAMAGCAGRTELELPVGSGGSGGSAGSSGGDGGEGCETTTTTGAPVCPPSECSAFSGPIAGKQACDDSMPTTVDRCFAVGNCGGFCARVPGQCDSLDPIGVQASTCADANECTVDLCGQQNACEHAPVPDKTPCPGGFCLSGQCV